MTINERLDDFLKLGHLKNIQFGITLGELINILGESDWKYYSSNNDTDPPIHKYGRIEFHFESNNKDATLLGIMFQPIPSAAGNGNLNCNYNGWTKNTDIGKARELLRTSGIEFQEKLHADNESKLLLTEGQVNIFFDCQEESGHFLLNKLGKFVDV